MKSKRLLSLVMVIALLLFSSTAFADVTVTPGEPTTDLPPGGIWIDDDLYVVGGDGDAAQQATSLPQEPTALGKFVRFLDKSEKVMKAVGDFATLGQFSKAFENAQDAGKRIAEEGVSAETLLHAGKTVAGSSGRIITGALITGGTSGRASIASGLSKGTIVLGRGPGYIETAKRIGAKYFKIADKVWNKMSKAEKWSANKKFLDAAIKRGDKIILSTRVVNIGKIKKGTFFRKELDYLLKKGYSLVKDGTMMIRVKLP